MNIRKIEVKLSFEDSKPFAKPSRIGRKGYSELAILTLNPYFNSVKATLTSKGQITIPLTVRKKLGLKSGQILDFDENAPFLKAIPSFDEKEMRSVIGTARSRLKKTSREWLDETRGPGPVARKK